jgi:hypothetical protein
MPRAIFYIMHLIGSLLLMLELTLTTKEIMSATAHSNYSFDGTLPALGFSSDS